MAEAVTGDTTEGASGRPPIGTFADFGEFDPAIDKARAIGIDSGATLTKLCALLPGGTLHFATWASAGSPDTSMTERLAHLIDRLDPERLGVTGCGAAAVLARVDREAVSPIEFDAWARGANRMLHVMGEAIDEPYLLVSIGTGTSALRIEGDTAERIGGTALGGGAALGLGHALLGTRDPAALNALAIRGDRSQVDLMISDLFDDSSAIANATVASAFGKLARQASQPEALYTRPSDEDLAAAVVGIVSDNIGLLACAQASAAGVSRIVYGGSTFEAHPQIAITVKLIGAAFGHDSIVLPHGAHAGALGVMLLAGAEY